ncbi:hypothetical protein GBK34_05295, partial [Bifidobacterium longum]
SAASEHDQGDEVGDAVEAVGHADGGLPREQAARPRARRVPEDHLLLRARGPAQGTGHDGRAHRIPRRQRRCARMPAISNCYERSSSCTLRRCRRSAARNS